ncbi:aminodeoxychorismate synthase component I [Cellvibrio zantedeschiae]|uniref:aminodeoxychorismate synthase n=1 Tax=Cellvibrio zantedeschiae TaxID=1237077 RepID=A0ABQ3B1J9_9GAMM|nr:aminodeoxychorismate synthase component I [Cellvibrio zantedeschiae]GGY70837.1 aminodeoxychorismate synthase component I [Cellvibrio zantedeschiae]
MSIAARLISVPYYPSSADWFVQVRQLAMPIWLDSGRPHSNYGRFDIISADPAITLKTVGQLTHVEADGICKSSTENPFTLLQTYLPHHHNTLEQLPFCGGALGYFGYDLGRRLENLPELARQDIGLPDMCVGIYPWAIVQDHQEQQSWLVINQHMAPAYNFLEIERVCSNEFQKARLHDLKQTLKSDENSFNISNFESNLKVIDYSSAIKRVKAYITAGDCYQVNFAQRFSAEFEGDSFLAYLKLRDSLPSPFSAYMELKEGAILSLSPERFIKLEQQVAETKPIKGTIARGKTPDEDLANAKALEASLKDRAENLMIVDLLRNDLSKTCTDVKVPELFSLQSFANVHHLVSTVTGNLKPGATALDLLASSFPGGSITGAPKIRAMEIIEELEPVRRSVYCGSLGYISACGNMDTNIAIRTLLCDGNKIHCWGGGGIVADSEIEKEYQESIAKVKVLLETLEQNFSKQKS